MNDDERLALAIVRARATDVPMRICSEAEAEELPQLRARIAALEAERERLQSNWEVAERELAIAFSRIQELKAQLNQIY
jgi:chromosome segregation ATPase